MSVSERRTYVVNANATGLATYRFRKACYSAIILFFVISTGVSAANNRPNPLTPPENTLRFESFDSQPVVLLGSDARRQCLVTETSSDGLMLDRTRSVTYHCKEPGIVECDATGYIKPLRDGQVTLIAKDASGLEATLQIEVRQWANDPAVSFSNQVVPIFTKLGCNSGGCHGKAAGQSGFKLSLLGFEPHEDYIHLVKESRGRRISPTVPDQSLLLTKTVNAIPHGGGQRLEKNSHEYRVIRRWISQGMIYGDENAATVVSLQIVPDQRRMWPMTSQQISVLATYTNGIVEDVTRTVQFESNDLDMADVTTSGLVSIKDLAGQVAVMARYQGQVATFRAAVPLVGEKHDWPEATNAVDVAVIEQLRRLNIPMSELCDDPTFLRRTTLDLAGRLPTLDEVHSFLADSTIDKRDTVIDRLLASDDYADNFANKWMLILRNRRDNPTQQSGTFAFYRWIRQSLDDNRPYDQFVRGIVTASGAIDMHPPVAWYRNVSDTNSGLKIQLNSSLVNASSALDATIIHLKSGAKSIMLDYQPFSRSFAAKLG